MRLLFPAPIKRVSLSFAARFALPLAAILALVVAAASPARAQNFADDSKWELGGHYAFLTLPSQCTGGSTCESSNSGLGANVTYNFSSWIGIDTEMDFFGDNGSASTNLTGGNVTEGLFGLRFGPTTRRWGLYSVIRPGFVNFGRVLGPMAASGAPAPSAVPGDIPSLAPTPVPRFSAVLNYQASSTTPVAMLGCLEVVRQNRSRYDVDVQGGLVCKPGADVRKRQHERAEVLVAKRLRTVAATGYRE